MYHKKRPKKKNTSQLQIARSARRKYQCKNLGSHRVRKMTVGIKHETDPRIIRFFTGPADRSFAPPGIELRIWGSTKNGSFYYPFPAESVYCKGNLRTFRKFQEYVFFFCCVAFLIMRSHLSTTFCVAWLSSDLHASLWNLRLDKHTCCSHPQKKTSLQVLFGTFRQILDESARIRSNSPSVV